VFWVVCLPSWVQCLVFAKRFLGRNFPRFSSYFRQIVDLFDTYILWLIGIGWAREGSTAIAMDWRTETLVFLPMVLICLVPSYFFAKRNLTVVVQ
jgi:hypothetical protein